MNKEQVIAWAREALETSPMSRKNKDAIDALREALAEQLAQQKPVNEGWKLVPVEPTEDMWKAVNKLDDEMAAGSYDGKGCSIEQAWNCLLAAAPQPAQQEPVDWEAVAADQAMTIAMMKAEREPLTDEQIEALRRSDDLFEDAPMWRLIARAIEAAHGIKGGA